MISVTKPPIRYRLVVSLHMGHVGMGQWGIQLHRSMAAMQCHCTSHRSGMTVLNHWIKSVAGHASAITQRVNDETFCLLSDL